MNELADVDKQDPPDDYEENGGGKFDRLESQYSIPCFWHTKPT